MKIYNCSPNTHKDTLTHTIYLSLKNTHSHTDHQTLHTRYAWLTQRQAHTLSSVLLCDIQQHTFAWMLQSTHTHTHLLSLPSSTPCCVQPRQTPLSPICHWIRLQTAAEHSAAHPDKLPLIGFRLAERLNTLSPTSLSLTYTHSTQTYTLAGGKRREGDEGRGVMEKKQNSKWQKRDKSRLTGKLTCLGRYCCWKNRIKGEKDANLQVEVYSKEAEHKSISILELQRQKDRQQTGWWTANQTGRESKNRSWKTH